MVVCTTKHFSTMVALSCSFFMLAEYFQTNVHLRVYNVWPHFHHLFNMYIYFCPLSLTCILQPEEFRSPPDVYAIGFEELVGLTAGNIVSASSSNRKEWGAELQKVLSQYQPYELLTAEQLVGICLYIFVQPKLIPYIRFGECTD